MTEKFHNVDFLKFILATAIVLVHMGSKRFFGIPFINDAPPLGVGDVVVHMFFIMSGFFCFYAPKINLEWGRVCRDRFLRLAPLIIIFTLIYLAIHLLGMINFEWSRNIFNMLLIPGSMFFKSKDILPSLHPAWFAAALFWASMVYFFIVKNFDKKWATLLIGAVAWVAFNIHMGMGKQVFFTVRLARAFAFVGIGYFIAQIYSVMLKDMKNQMTIMGCVVETACLIFVMLGIFYKRGPYSPQDNMLLLLFICLFGCFITKCGAIGRFVNAKKFGYLGSWSYAIFITHIFVLDMTRLLVWPMFSKAYILDNAFAARMLILLACVLFGGLSHHFIEVPVNRWIKRRQRTGGMVA